MMAFLTTINANFTVDEKFNFWLNLIFDEANLATIEHYLSEFFARDYENNNNQNFCRNIDNHELRIQILN